MEGTGIWIENFLSIKKAEIKLDKRGLVLIEGKNLTSNKFKSNGAGKSSIIESIVYVLYDTTSKGLKADDVINNKVGKNTSVIYEGKQDGHTYRIERYRKHTKHKNKVKLFVDGKDITGKSAAETNKMIERIIGIDYHTFVNSILFSQSSGAGRFAIATDKEKKEILESVVNLVVYAQAQAITKERIKGKDNEILTKQREIERTNWEFAQVDQLEQQDQQNYENTKTIIAQERTNLGTTMEEMAKYAQHYFQPTEDTKEEIEELKRKSADMATVNISAYMEAAQKAGQDLKDYNNAIQRLNEHKADLVAKYKQVQLSTNCPVCGNDLDPVHREQEMASIKEQLRDLLLKLQIMTPQQVQLQEAYTKADAAYLHFKPLYDDSMNDYRKVIDDIRIKEQQVSNYERTLQNYKEKVQHIKNTLETLGKLPEPQKREKERESIRGKLKAQKEELLALEKQKQQLETVVKVYSNSGVKSHILDLVTPFLNQRGNEYLAILSGPEMELKFSTQTKNKDGSVSDKFDLQVINHAGGDDYKAQSEGEKKRADLSIALALQDFVASKAPMNFALYDEVFDALDEVGAENTITLLREREKTVGTIFVITHSEHLKPFFNKTITVTKNKNGESTITEGELMT